MSGGSRWGGRASLSSSSSSVDDHHQLLTSQPARQGTSSTEFLLVASFIPAGRGTRRLLPIIPMIYDSQSGGHDSQPKQNTLPQVKKQARLGKRKRISTRVTRPSRSSPIPTTFQLLSPMPSTAYKTCLLPPEVKTFRELGIGLRE